VRALVEVVRFVQGRLELVGRGGAVKVEDLSFVDYDGVAAVAAA